jgi:hypothetical protein
MDISFALLNFEKENYMCVKLQKFRKQKVLEAKG